MTLTGISDADRDLALNATYAGKTFMLGLFTGDDEIDDPSYDRVSVTFSGPMGDDLRHTENVDEARFAALSEEHDIDHWGIFDASGDLRARMRLKESRTVPANDRATFDPGALRIGLP